MTVLIAVLAAEHEVEDAWVIERASVEAERAGIDLPPYRGTAVMPSGAPVHLYCESEAAVVEARETWAGMVAAQNAAEDAEGDSRGDT